MPLLSMRHISVYRKIKKQKKKKTSRTKDALKITKMKTIEKYIKI